MCKILANMTQVSAVAPGPLVYKLEFPVTLYEIAMSLLVTTGNYDLLENRIMIALFITYSSQRLSFLATNSLPRLHDESSHQRASHYQKSHEHTIHRNYF
jgi:hypothetical protein